MRNCSTCACRNPDDVERCVECGTLLDAPEKEKTPALEAELLPLIREGRKIEAIKIHRERTGMGLRESKAAVESMAGREGLGDGTSGCFGMIAVALIFLAGVASALAA